MGVFIIADALANCCLFVVGEAEGDRYCMPASYSVKSRRSKGSTPPGLVEDWLEADMMMLE